MIVLKKPYREANGLGIITGKGPFFFDGAFGTYYHSIFHKSFFCEYANLSDPDSVLAIHKEYIAAGASAVKTNTFGANPLLTEDPDKLLSILKEGYSIAKKAVSGTDVQVFADIGGFQSSSLNLSQEYKKIARSFISCGATRFIFETLSEFDPIIPALKLIREKVADPTVIVSFAVSQDGTTSRGYSYQKIMKTAAESPYVDIVGLNCLCGPSHMYELLRDLCPLPKPLCAMPNAGYPATINGRTVYLDNAEYFSRKIADIYSLGVRILGGCCGTTPQHIRQMIATIEGQPSLAPAEVCPLTEKSPRQAIKNPLESLFASSRKIIAVELDSPAAPYPDTTIPSALALSEAGADLITIADSPLARTRADSIMTAARILRETGLGVLPHLACRDRNHIGIKAALIAGQIEGLQNILVVTGDPIAQTDRDEYKGVFSFNSAGLISYIRRLNEELFETSPYFIGAAIDPNAAQFKNELSRARKKTENGAQFFLSQPLFSKNAIENLARAKSELTRPVLAGILPLASYKNALFLNNEVAGISIPQDLIERLCGKDAKDTFEISLDFSMDIVSKIQSFCDGYYIMTPLGKVDLAAGLVRKIRSHYT
jgi:homocysteine S-methyltransferase